MKNRSRVRPLGTSALLLTALYVVLAGLFGMHGLGAHGSAMPPEPGMAHPMAQPMAQHQAPQATLPMVAPDATVLAASMPSMHMGTACLAVLLSLLLLVAARQTGFVPLPRPALLSLAARTRPVPRGPPDLVALGIHRC